MYSCDMKIQEDFTCAENESGTKSRYFLLGFYCGFFVAIVLYFLLSSL
jgi:tetrahydromethanopterin S-methyltransferase subunit F